MFPRTILSAALLLSCAATAPAQYLPPPARGLAPLLHVRLIGPAGMHAVVYQGMAPPRDLTAPVPLGLRPGYIYRVELNGFARYPGISLYPTLEVRGTLAMPAGVSAAGYPAPVVITEDDVRMALAGALVTKVIYLENPERAVPAATTPDDPVETSLPPDRNLLVEAHERGRPVLVLRFGQLEFMRQEMAMASVAGTVLFPGEHVLGQPAAPPMLPWACFPWYDPTVGPAKPEDEWIHNGCINPPAPHYLGNGKPQRAGLDNEGRIQGLNPEDTVAEYRDSRGRKSLTCSNRVCLLVPRFGVLRTEIGLSHYAKVVAVADRREVRGQEQVGTRVPSLVTRQTELARAVAQKANVSGNEVVTRTDVVGRVAGGPQVVSDSVLTRDLMAIPSEAPRALERPLVLTKDVDKHAAQPGEVVTFTLTYSNRGGLPITDVAVVDSLSPRLEYVPGTSVSDREAVFTMQQNEAGSLMLRWEIGGKLLPGESGVIRFQAKVR
jgi:uncharacterized repeat protein (TIGR01451 family)